MKVRAPSKADFRLSTRGHQLPSARALETHLAGGQCALCPRPAPRAGATPLPVGSQTSRSTQMSKAAIGHAEVPAGIRQPVGPPPRRQSPSSSRLFPARLVRTRRAPARESLESSARHPGTTPPPRVRDRSLSVRAGPRPERRGPLSGSRKTLSERLQPCPECEGPFPESGKPLSESLRQNNYMLGVATRVLKGTIRQHEL